MDIHEMHDEFILIGQKMGMKDIRTLLPESIDTFINKAINNKIRNIILTNNSVIQNKMLSKELSINIINSLSTLYTKYFFKKDFSKAEKYYNCFIDIDDVLYYTSFSVKYENIDRTFNCRSLHGDELENILNDFCNGASYEYPIVTLFNVNNEKDFRVYTNNTNKKIEYIIINYIRKPALVKFNNELNKSINCDLPEYLHNEIVELAVNEFIKSINVNKNNV